MLKTWLQAMLGVAAVVIAVTISISQAQLPRHVRAGLQLPRFYGRGYLLLRPDLLSPEGQRHRRRVFLGTLAFLIVLLLFAVSGGVA